MINALLLALTVYALGFIISFAVAGLIALTSKVLDIVAPDSNK